MICGWTIWERFAALRAMIGVGKFSRRAIVVYGNGAYNAVNGEWPGDVDPRNPEDCSVARIVRDVERFTWNEEPTGTGLVSVDYEKNRKASHGLDTDAKERTAYRAGMGCVLREAMNAWRRKMTGRDVGFWCSIEPCDWGTERARAVNADPIRGQIRAASDFLTVVMYGATGLMHAADSLAEAKRVAGAKRWWPIIGDPPRGDPGQPGYYAGHDAVIVRGLIEACRIAGAEPIWWAYPLSDDEAIRLEACAGRVLGMAGGAVTDPA